MRHLGYQEKVVRILEDLYCDTLSAVRVNGGITEWFATLVGVLQGCVLSPLLFNIFLEVVLARALWYLDISVVISGYRLNNLRFADDIVAICNSNQGLDTIVTSIATESRRMGMNINTDKTETQLIGRYWGSCDIKLEGQVLSHVEDFVYLGGLISSTGSSQPDVCRRIGLACDAVRRLAKIWKNKAISEAAKVQSVWNDGVEHIVLQLGNMDTYCRNKQTAQSFWNRMLETDHGRHAKRPYQKRGHHSQLWHYRGYSRENPGKKTTIFQSSGKNGPTPSAKHWVEGKRESKEDTGSAGWIMLLTTAIIEAGASWRLHT